MLLYYQHYFLGSVLYCATLERVFARIVFRFVFRGFSLSFVSFSWFILFTFIFSNFKSRFPPITTMLSIECKVTPVKDGIDSEFSTSLSRLYTVPLQPGLYSVYSVDKVAQVQDKCPTQKWAYIQVCTATLWVCTHHAGDDIYPSRQ